jgi:hypothetical protein
MTNPAPTMLDQLETFLRDTITTRVCKSMIELQ